MKNFIKKIGKKVFRSVFSILILFFVLIVPSSSKSSGEISKNDKDSLLNVINNSNIKSENYSNENHLNSALLVQQAISKIAKTSLNAVVSIKGVKLVKNNNYKLFNDFFKFFQPYPYNQEPNKQKSMPQRPQTQISMGSGFIIDKNGFVITNNHVINNAKNIKITLQNNDQYNAKVVFESKSIDIALLKIESDRSNFSSISLGNSDEVNIGDFTIAVGNPFGSLSGTYTFGIVSSKARDISNVSLDYSNNYNNYIQTDAAINVGNSGGPLLNIKGEVIGINTLIYSPGGVGGFSGIGFAIPINFVKTVLTSFIKTGSFKTSQLGVLVKDLDEGLIEYFNLKSKNGCFINSITEGTPAEKSLKPGDIILEFDNKLVTNCSSLRMIIAYSNNKEDHTVKIFRNSEVLSIKVKLIEKEEEKNIDEKDTKENNQKDYNAANFINIKLGEIKDYSSKFSLNKNLEGLVVLSIEENFNVQYSSPLREGDIIEEINFKKVNSLSDLKSFQKDVENKKSFMLKVKSLYQNDWMTNFVVIKFTE